MVTLKVRPKESERNSWERPKREKQQNTTSYLLVNRLYFHALSHLPQLQFSKRKIVDPLNCLKEFQTFSKHLEIDSL